MDIQSSRLSHFRPAEGCHRGGAKASAFPAGDDIRNRAQGSARVGRTVTVVHTRSLVTGFFRLILTGGGNRLTLDRAAGGRR
jgi:hypothetical protein